MTAQLYTLNEITEALRWMASENDSIEHHMKSGDFRRKFSQYVMANRAKRDTGEVADLHDRLIPIRYEGADVYLLDDVQGALTKQQFAAFVQLMRTHQIRIELDEATYVPTKLIDLFIKDQLKVTKLKDTPSPDTLPEEVKEMTEPRSDRDDEPAILEFA
jgi:hypothetical protein